MKTSVVTARLDEDTLVALDRLAEHHERSRAWLVAKAVSRYVKEEGAFLAFLREGEEAIDRGDYVTHDDLVAEIREMRRGQDAA